MMIMNGSKIAEAAVLPTRQLTEGQKPIKCRKNPPPPPSKNNMGNLFTEINASSRSSVKLASDYFPSGVQNLSAESGKIFPCWMLLAKPRMWLQYLYLQQ
jgi:hypothetical protein